jgi:outer membrane scaffolding protein for murein synthesis (MipA/OmpV family)
MKGEKHCRGLMGHNSFSSRSGLYSVLFSAMFLLLSAPVEAYHLPKWEWGLGAGMLNVPAYRGAKGHKNYLLPVPFVAYRGEALRMDEDGMRGRLFESDRIRLDLSIAGNLPVPEDSDSARAGMPNLDPVGEFGPTLDISLTRNGDRHEGETSVWLRLPVRAAISVGAPLLAQQGWVFSPYVDLSYRKGATRSHWRVSLALGPLYATRKYHEYFYKVPAEFVTAQRPQYQPDGGYSGSRATLTLVMNSRHWFIGAFARYDKLDGAVFEDSPLVEINNYFAVGFAVSRIFGSSSEKAPH